MILDHADQSARYEALHPGFARALAMLRGGQLSEYPPGRHTLDGERLMLIVEQTTGRGRDGAVLEVHKRFIDIQVCLEGDEVMGWRSLQDCSQISQPYDADRDLAFFAERPESWLELAPNTFAIFWPEDAHAPLAGTGPVLKAVFKVAVDWS